MTSQLSSPTVEHIHSLQGTALSGSIPLGELLVREGGQEASMPVTCVQSCLEDADGQVWQDGHSSGKTG